MLIGQRKRDVVARRDRIRGGRGRPCDGGRRDGDTDEHRWRICPQGCAHPLTVHRRAENVQRFTKFPLTTCSPPLLLVSRRVHGHKVFPGTDTPRSRTSWESSIPSRTDGRDIQGRKGRAEFSSSFFSFFFWEGLSCTGCVLSVAGWWLLEVIGETQVWLDLDFDFSREMIDKTSFQTFIPVLFSTLLSVNFGPRSVETAASRLHVSRD